MYLLCCWFYRLIEKHYITILWICFLVFWKLYLRVIGFLCSTIYNIDCTKGKKVKCSRYRPGVAQTVGRGIAVLFHDRGTRRGCVVSSTLRLHFTPGKDPVPIVQEAGWTLGPVWTGGKSRPHRYLIPAHPACSSVAIPTELPGPHTDCTTKHISSITIYNIDWNARYVACVCVIYVFQHIFVRRG